MKNVWIILAVIAGMLTNYFFDIDGAFLVFVAVVYVAIQLDTRVGELRGEIYDLKETLAVHEAKIKALLLDR